LKPCSLVENYQRFGGTCCFHVQGNYMASHPRRPIFRIIHFSTTCVELHLHSSYVFMVWCLIRYTDNFTFTAKYTANNIFRLIF
jgi:hypothetical protein